MIRTSIIIPTYNGRGLLEECVYTIRQHTHSVYEIIVVDNGSTDGTTDFCRQEGVPFISAPTNFGFPKACNLGLRIASGDALLLLNNDVMVTPMWLDNMLHCLYSAEDVGIVGPVTNYASGKQQIDIPFTNIQEMADRYNRPNRKKWFEVRRIVGLCFLFKRELLNKVGYLDERFSPGHFEDDDFCLRVRQAGYRLFVAGDVFIFHHGSKSFTRQGEDSIKQLIADNKQKFVEKWGVQPESFFD